MLTDIWALSSTVKLGVLITKLPLLPWGCCRAGKPSIPEEAENPLFSSISDKLPALSRDRKIPVPEIFTPWLAFTVIVPPAPFPARA